MPKYKHKTIRNYVVMPGKFEFKNFMLDVADEDEEEFLRLHAQLPPLRQRQIVIYNEEAAQLVEQRIIRGATGSTSMNAGESHPAGQPSPSQQQIMQSGQGGQGGQQGMNLLIRK